MWPYVMKNHVKLEDYPSHPDIIKEETAWSPGLLVRKGGCINTRPAREQEAPRQ